MDLLSAVLHAMRQRHYEALDALGMGTDFRRIFLTGGGAEVVRRLLPEYEKGDGPPAHRRLASGGRPVIPE